MNEKAKAEYVRVEFSRRFISGNLIHLNHDGGMTFDTRGSAARWLKGIRRNSRNGSIDYKLQKVTTFSKLSCERAERRLANDI